MWRGAKRGMNTSDQSTNDFKPLIVYGAKCFSSQPEVASSLCPPGVDSVMVASHRGGWETLQAHAETAVNTGATSSLSLPVARDRPRWGRGGLWMGERRKPEMQPEAARHRPPVMEKSQQHQWALSLAEKKKEEEIKSNCVPGIQTDKSIIRKKKKQ